jgi:hypothetical protein
MARAASGEGGWRGRGGEREREREQGEGERAREGERDAGEREERGERGRRGAGPADTRMYCVRAVHCARSTNCGRHRLTRGPPSMCPALPCLFASIANSSNLWRHPPPPTTATRSDPTQLQCEQHVAGTRERSRMRPLQCGSIVGPVTVGLVHSRVSLRTRTATHDLHGRS